MKILSTPSFQSPKPQTRPTSPTFGALASLDTIMERAGSMLAHFTPATRQEEDALLRTAAHRYSQPPEIIQDPDFREGAFTAARALGWRERPTTDGPVPNRSTVPSGPLPSESGIPK